MTALAAGMLLVATPSLADPSFAATVVLLLDVDPDQDGGAIGVVLNRPSGVAVAEVIGAWGEVVDEPEVLFQGGPVSTEGVLALGLLHEGAERPAGFQALGGLLGFVDLDTPPALVAPALAGLRIYAGYAGWAVGQLEREVEEGSWYVVPALDADAFRADPAHLGRDVLRRQPGELAWNATRPADPGLN